MQVLVTGADGFVGRHLCGHLREQGDSVAEAYGPDPQSRGQETSAVDVTDPVGLRAAVETARPDAIIHLAGFSSVAKSHADPSQTFAVNTLGAVHLLAAARDVAPKARILLIGSAECYGALAAGVRATEELPLQPLSPYAASKVAAEVAGFQFHRATGLAVIGVRLSGLTKKLVGYCFGLPNPSGIACARKGGCNVRPFAGISSRHRRQIR